MKLRKKIRKYISFIVSLVIFIQPLFLQSQLIASQNCYHEQRIQEKKIIEVNQNNNDVSQSSAYCNDSSYYMDITPSKLNGLNLKELFRVVVECAYETNSLNDLPDGLIKCCKSLENGATSLYMPDLAEALPVVIEKIMDPKTPEILSRAPHLKALGTQGAFGGPLLDCNLGRVIQLLNELLQTINQCCNELKFDFDGTFSVISNLVLSASCDFTAVLTTNETNFGGTFTEINDIKNTLTACCEQLEFDFNGVFTALANIVITTCDLTSIFTANISNFQGTFTVLDDIKNTLTACCEQLQVNFDGTFTSIANLIITVTCDFTPIFTILSTNFEGTFTVLDDIKNTLTACCEQLQVNFDGTFTSIANFIITATCDVDVAFTIPTIDISGAFTSINDIKNTLTACCEQLQFDFAGTFTELANLTSVLCNVSSTVTILTTNFEGTFTVLNDIKSTLTACCEQLQFNFDGTFSILANLAFTTTCDFTPVFTILSTNFEGTFTAINDIKNTLTACCEQLQFNFDGTFTSLANLVIDISCDFTPIFTSLQDINDTLTACCEQLQFNFGGTFTTLANLVVTASCDFATIFTALQDVKNSLTSICNNFNNTFTLLSDVRNTLTSCCAALESNFDGTFTVLAGLLTTPTCDIAPIFTVLNDINTTLTACCEQLQFDFDGTFSVLANLKTTVTVDLSAVFTVLADIKNTLTECCSEIQQDFGGTFTAITDIVNSLRTLNLNSTFSVLDVLTAAICDPIVITQSDFGVGGATPLVISAPGVYIFGENIRFNPVVPARAITITTSDVILDLQCFTLRQGNATSGVDAVRVNSGLTDVTIKNGTITNFSRAGITVQNNNARTMIENVTCVTCGVRGIELLGTVGNLIEDSKIENCTIDAWFGDYAVIAQQLNRCNIVSLDIRNSGTGALAGIRLDTCTQIDLDTMTIVDNSSNAASFSGMQLVAPVRSSFSNCDISFNNLAAIFTGIEITGSLNRFNMFNNCKVINNTAGTALFGISLGANSTNNMFENCSVSWNVGVVTLGISLTGGGANNNQNSFVNIIVSANTGTTGCSGFFINGSDSGMLSNSIISDNVAPVSGQATGVAFGAPNGGNTWTMIKNQTFRNTGINPASSFGILRSAGSDNLFITNISFRNGGVGAIPANQISGVSVGTVFTPPAPASANLNVIFGERSNPAVAA